MSMLTSNWFWIGLVLFLGGWYLFGRGHGKKAGGSLTSLGIGDGHGYFQDQRTGSSGPQPSQKQEQQQGHKEQGGCC